MMQFLILLIFVAGYAAIVSEQQIRINRAASALIAGVGCWIVYILYAPVKEAVTGALLSHLSGISGILFFLLSALVIVELMDAHDGFDFIKEKIRVKSKRKLLWVISIITFFLSSVLNNMTTAIVMLSLTRKMVNNPRDRWLFAGMIIISANAGGAWTPIGDVTTTMLWIGNQVTTLRLMPALFLPCVVCLLVPLILASWMLKDEKLTFEISTIKEKTSTTPFERNFIFLAGLTGLLSVPVFEALTSLPPYMGMVFSLGVIWAITEIIHSGKNEEEKNRLSVIHALRKADVPTILFFLGILLSIAALDSSGILGGWAMTLGQYIKSQGLIAVIIGLVSAVVDNVPLVAAVQGMYPLSLFPTDHYIWEFIAYTAGTGGSILIIGSAAGIAAMGIEKISFGGYLKRISLLALAGYFAGSLIYYLQFLVFQ